MSGLFVAIILIASLLLVHFSIRSRPMPDACPLNVDDGLPLPEASQASTVFSLTALFGAYLGILLLLGIPALVGVTSGTICGLLLIHYWVKKAPSDTYEEFLSSIFLATGKNGVVLGLVLSGIQCAYAASELLILREVGQVFLGIRAEQSTIFATSVGLIAYFYVLFGGYIAVFRTDILQFLLLGFMILVFGYTAIENLNFFSINSIDPRPGYWTPPLVSNNNPLLTIIYHFVVGAVMGFGFLLAAPDAWKRVFVVMSGEKRSRFRFILFVVVGFLPFVALIPVSFNLPPIPNGHISASQMYTGHIESEFLYVCAAVGFISCFLSSFDSALLSSVHVNLITKRRYGKPKSEYTAFYWLMTVSLIVIFLFFQIFVSFGNSYILANFLLGPFAVASGIMAGTMALSRRIPGNTVIWLATIGIGVWSIYFTTTVDSLDAPNTYQINTVPVGVLLFIVIAGICFLLNQFKRIQ